eukprot:scaffold1410_cov76-Skeletonema_dohrnii-CCMP3373.AAC.5
MKSTAQYRTTTKNRATMETHTMKLRSQTRHDSRGRTGGNSDSTGDITMMESNDNTGHRLDLTSSSPKQTIPRLQGAMEKNDDAENVNLNIPNDSSPSSSAAVLNGATDDSFENDNGLAANHGTTTVLSETAREVHDIFLNMMKPLQQRDPMVSPSH